MNKSIFEILSRMNSKKGNELPPDTPVYMCMSIHTKIYDRTSRYVIDSSERISCMGLYFNTYLFEFIFDPEDGLWATSSARHIWNQFPQFHPHATLFSILHNKLHLQ